MSSHIRSLFLSQPWLLRRAHCQPRSGHQCPPGPQTTGFCMRNFSCRFLKTFSFPCACWEWDCLGVPRAALGTIERFDRCAFHPFRSSFPSTHTRQTSRGVIITFRPGPQAILACLCVWPMDSQRAPLPVLGPLGPPSSACNCRAGKSCLQGG